MNVTWYGRGYVELIWMFAQIKSFEMFDDPASVAWDLYCTSYCDKKSFRESLNAWKWYCFLIAMYSHMDSHYMFSDNYIETVPKNIILYKNIEYMSTRKRWYI